MEFINTIERQLTTWFDRVPHLPTNVRAWLVRNIWWIMLVIAIFSIMGFGVLLLGALVGGALATMLAGVVGFAVSGVAFGALLLLYVPGLVVALLLLAAVSPLRAQLAKGWRWLFLATLLDISLSLIQLALSMSGRGLFTFILTSVIALYALFEIRSSFVAKKSAGAVGDQPAFTPASKK